MVNPEGNVEADYIGPHGKEFGFYSYMMEKCRGILRKRMAHFFILNYI